MDYRNRNIDASSTLLESLKKMDVIDKKLLIVIENEKFVGLLSAGDIQRAIIDNKSLNLSVKDILRKNINRGFIKLRVWQDALELFKLVNEVTKDVPYKLNKSRNNVLDAAHSILRNIPAL